MPNLCKLGKVFLTVVEEEEYNYSNDITERAVEDGTNISDNAKSNLTTIRISGIITGKDSYPEETLTLLKVYCKLRTVLTYTGIQNFSNVIIESFNSNHNKELANGTFFDINLKQIKVVRKVSLAINTSKLNVPDIEKIKKQLEDQKQAEKDAKKSAKAKVKTQTKAKTKVKSKTTKGRQPKKKKQKQSALDKVLTKY
ncbi:phage baseplate protein [Clostridium rectalis]|uniref:phage baseplate protein n=1 Tax=Clostridium rectalis TaxID=2040295 RepID=UPI000F641E66|nr:hypothetical protein [Clostridium rectalis]